MSSKKLDYQGRAFSDSDLQELPLKDVAYPYEEVNFSQNRLSAEGLRKVLELCSRCEKLRILKLYKNDINDDAAQALCGFIRKCYSLEELHLSHNRFTAKGVEMLVKAAQEARYEVDGGAPMWMRLEQNEVRNPDQVLSDLQNRYSVCSKSKRSDCSNRVCIYNCKVHLPHFHFQRDEYGQANNEGPRKRKWERSGGGDDWSGGDWSAVDMAEPQKDTDWREGRDDWFDGRPEVRKDWEESWEGAEERPVGVKMAGGIFMRAMGAIVQNSADDDGRGEGEPPSKLRRAVPNNVASRTLSQLGVLAEPRKSKVMLKEAPRGIKDEADDEEQEAEEEDEGQMSDDKDEEDDEEEPDEGRHDEKERGRPSRGVAQRRGRTGGERREDRERRAQNGHSSRRRREEGTRHREAVHRRAQNEREPRERRRSEHRAEHRSHRDRADRAARGQRERSRERRRASAQEAERDRGKRRDPDRRKDRGHRSDRDRRRVQEAEAASEAERPRRRDDRAAAGERTEKLFEKMQGSRDKRESKAVTKQEPQDLNKAPVPFVATRAKAAPRRPATANAAAPAPRPKGTATATQATQASRAVAAPKVAAKAKAAADGNESEYTYTEASEYTYEDVEGEEEEEAVEVEDDDEEDE